jgi:hypothetical protein
MNLKSTSVLAGLLATSALTLSTVPAQAATLFGNEGIKFDVDTIVDFNFVRSQGLFQSTLSIVTANDLKVVKPLFTENVPFDKTSPDFFGFCPKTVTASGTASDCTNSFLFQAGVDYSFALNSGAGNPAGTNGIVYSTNSLNTPVSQQAFFFKPPVPSEGDRPTAPNPSSGDPFAGPVVISFDDLGANNDKDFQDYIFTAQARPVPEPATLGGLALVGGAMAMLRRRKRAQVS